MKKIVSILLTLCMLTGVVFTLASCGGGGGGGHTHNYSTDWSNSNTHHWHDCDGCDMVADYATHTFGEWTTAGEEQHKRTCSVCAYEVTDGHTWGEGEVTTEPTPEADGVETFTCTDCGATKTAPIEYGHTHQYGEWVSISDTQHKKVCECEAEIVENHAFDGGELSEGVITYTCTLCGKTKTETVVEAPVAIVNPYASVDWDTADTVKSMTHMHILTQANFESALAQGYQHFAITNYMPSTPTYPLSDFFTNIPDNIIASPNTEKAFTTNSLNHFSTVGSFASGHGNVKNELNQWVPQAATHSWQAVFDDVFANLQYPDAGGITLNHPLVPGDQNIDSYINMLDYDDRVLGIEIYNDSACGIYGMENHEDFLEYWDYILSTGRRCWGFAVVDWQGGTEWGSHLLMLSEFDEHEALKAYRNGNFYSQLNDTGLRFNEISYEGGVITASVNREATIRFISEDGVVKTVNGTDATYIPSDETYVRIEVLEEGVEGSRIFSNPFMFKDREEVADEHDGSLELDNGTHVWNVVSGGTLGEVTTTVVWENDGTFTATEPTENLSDYTKYTIEWYSFGTAGPSLDGSSYNITKRLQIKSIKEGTSTEEASITWNGATYAAGDTVYRSGSTYWLGLSDFMGWAAPSTVFSYVPKVTPISKNGEVAFFEAVFRLDLGDFHKSGDIYTLLDSISLLVREGATNKLTSGFNISGESGNYVDVKRPGDGTYFTENNEARGVVGEEFTLRIEISELVGGNYEVKTFVNGIVIDTCEVAPFEVSNVKIDIGAQARDVSITVTEAKFLKYVDNYDKHIHTYDDAWSSDSKQHWHEHTCDAHAGCPYAKADLGNHVDSDSNSRCDVCDKPLLAAITVENPHGLTHTVPTDELENGATVTFTVSVEEPNGVSVVGAVQVGEPTLDGNIKTYTFRIESLDLSKPLRIERVKAGVANKVDYTTLLTTNEILITTYLKVTGNTVTEGTVTSYDYVVVWQSNQVSGPTLDGTSYTFGRSVAITSVKAFGSDAETAFTVSNVEYKAGTVIPKNALLGSYMWGTAETAKITSTSTLTAPLADPTLRMVWDTDIVVNSGTASGDQPISILYATFAGTNCTSSNGSDQLIRNGNDVIFHFGSDNYTVGTVGEKFNIRVEIRDVDPTHPDADSRTGNDTASTPGPDGIVDNIPVEIKLFINGILVATRIDQVDASSGNYDTMPTEVWLGCFSDTRDISLTLTDTYLDVYAAPAN